MLVMLVVVVDDEGDVEVEEDVENDEDNGKMLLPVLG